MSDLTLVAPGGVQRKDITTEDDIAAIQGIAANALEVANETEEYLGTRVPIGRMINGKTLDKDLILTGDDLNTYDKATIDQKIAAVQAGGYNPVRVNGKLLDKDITLTAGDIGTYTSTQIDTKVANLVPNSLTINGQQLNKNLTLTAADLGAYTSGQVDTIVAGLVPTSRTINGKNLGGNVTLVAGDVGAYTKAEAVPRTFSINGKQMTGDSMTISASDFNGYTRPEIDALLQTYIPVDNDWGLGNLNPLVLSDGTLSAGVTGAGFYGYDKITDSEDGSVHALTDAPSTTGSLIALSSGKTVNASPALAFPQDVTKLRYRRVKADNTETAWFDLYSTENKPTLTELGAFDDANVPAGREGDVLFVDATGSKKMSPEQVVQDARIVNSDVTLTAEKATILSAGDIFAKWGRVGLTNANGVDETQSWSYNATTGAIQCTRNTAALTGFVSPGRFDNWSLEAQMSSTDGDDDSVGLILAVTQDATNKYILAACRSPGGVGDQTWGVKVFTQNAAGTAQSVADITNKTSLVKWGNGNYGANATAAGYVTNTAGQGWSGFPQGCRIKASRVGSTITLDTSDLNSNTYISGATITLDLTTAALAKFNDKSSYGYFSWSQNATTFTTLASSSGDNKIYDARDGSVWSYSGSAWSLTAGASVFTDLEIGRIYSNPRTKKQFFLESKTRIKDISPAISLATVAVTGIRTDGDSGLIEQWGSITSTAAGEHIVTLPSPFPNAMFQVQATLTYNGNPGYASAKVIDKTSFMVFFAGGTDGSYAGAAWRVLGN